MRQISRKPLALEANFMLADLILLVKQGSNDVLLMRMKISDIMGH